MDQQKTGALIAALRKELGLTQRELADRLSLSDRTVSKWERGLGSPDVSLLPGLAQALHINIETLLSGALPENGPTGGNMKRSHYYICPACGNLTVCTGTAEPSCCGKKLEEAVPQKTTEEHALSAVPMDDEWFLTTKHPMTKAHHISFVIFATGEQLQLFRCWPEWDLQLHLPRRGHGLLLWYCTRHGLFYRNL